MRNVELKLPPGIVLPLVSLLIIISGLHIGRVLMLDIYEILWTKFIILFPRRLEVIKILKCINGSITTMTQNHLMVSVQQLMKR